MIPKPTIYPDYYATYFASLPNEPILAVLQSQATELPKLLAHIPEAKHTYAYADGKWPVKQLVAHMNDAERIFAYRILCFARGEKANLPGFDENSYAAAAYFPDVPLSRLAAEFGTVRAATLSLVEGLSPTHYERVGTANGAPVSVSALIHVIAAHAAHHIQVLHNRYGI